MRKREIYDPYYTNTKKEQYNIKKKNPLYIFAYLFLSLIHLYKRINYIW